MLTVLIVILIDVKFIKLFSFYSPNDCVSYNKILFWKVRLRGEVDILQYFKLLNLYCGLDRSGGPSVRNKMIL